MAKTQKGKTSEVYTRPRNVMSYGRGGRSRLYWSAENGPTSLSLIFVSITTMKWKLAMLELNCNIQSDKMMRRVMESYQQKMKLERVWQNVIIIVFSFRLLNQTRWTVILDYAMLSFLDLVVLISYTRTKRISLKRLEWIEKTIQQIQGNMVTIELWLFARLSLQENKSNKSNTVEVPQPRKVIDLTHQETYLQHDAPVENIREFKHKVRNTVVFRFLDSHFWISRL